MAATTPGPGAPPALLPLAPGILTARMVSGSLPFPYKRGHIRPPEWFFCNLLRGSDVTVSDTPYIARMLRARGRGSLRPALVKTPWGFNRREVSFVVGDSAHDDIDQITDHFTEDARMAANVRGSPCPLDAWRDPDTAAEIAAAAVAAGRRAGGVSPYHLREAAYERLAECTLFKASLAAAIYAYFGAKVVLDPFGGWGDRGLGAAGAGVEKYVGLDPNPALVAGHRGIVEFLGRAAPGTSIVYRSMPVEAYGPAEFAADFGDTPPALAFSSPPFHDYEIYSDDPDQSTRHKSLGAWLGEWFLPALDRVWGMLAPGGHLALYMTDEGGEVTTPLCDHMEAGGRTFCGVIACRRGTKRPLPLWVWKKSAGGVVGPPAPAVSAPCGGPRGLDGYVSDLLEEIYAEM